MRSKDGKNWKKAAEGFLDSPARSKANGMLSAPAPIALLHNVKLEARTPDALLGPAGRPSFTVKAEDEIGTGSAGPAEV